MKKIEESKKKNIIDKVKIQDYFPGLADPQYDASFTAPKVKSIKKIFFDDSVYQGHLGSHNYKLES